MLKNSIFASGLTGRLGAFVLLVSSVIVPNMIVAPAVASADDPVVDTESPKALSVAPLDQPIYPDDRPGWLDEIPELEQSPVVWPVKSLLRPSPEEALDSLQVQVNGAMAAYAENFLGSEAAEALKDDPLVVVDLSDFEAIDRYSGTVVVGETTLYEEAARLHLDSRYSDELKEAWQEHQLRKRLMTLGMFGGGAFCLLLAGTSLTRRIARKPV